MAMRLVYGLGGRKEKQRDLREVMMVVWVREVVAIGRAQWGGEAKTYSRGAGVGLGGG